MFYKRKFWKGLFLLVLIAGLFAKPSLAKAEILKDEGCPSAPARLKRGDIAVVIVPDADTLNLRVQPGLKEEIIVKIPKYEYVTVIGATAFCNDGYRWYEIGWNGKDGWAAEVGQDGKYNLTPNGEPIPTQNPITNSPNPSQALNLDEFGCPKIPITLKVGDIAVLLKIGFLHKTTFSSIESLMGVTISAGEKVEILAGPECGALQRWYKVRYKNHEGWLPEVGPYGPTDLIKEGPSTPITIEPTETAQPTEIPLPPDGYSGPSDPWCFIPGFCIDAAVITGCQPQCVRTARAKRDDLLLWGKSGTSDQILAIAQGKPTFTYKGQEMEVRVREPGEQPQAEDLVIWPWGCGGAWSPKDKNDNKLPGGHIGFVENGNPFTITDSNWGAPISENKCSERKNIQINVQSCMRFITKPYPKASYQPPPIDKCSQFTGWRWAWCKLFG